MIQLRPIIFTLGLLLCAVAATMAVPAVVDAADGNDHWRVFLASAAFTVFIGGLLLGAVVNLIAGYARKIGPVGTLFNKVAGLSSASVYLLLFLALYFLGRQTTRAAGVSSEESRTRDYLADLPFPARVREQLVAEGRAWPHHILPASGWVSYPIRDADAVPGALGLFRLAYERAAARRRDA